MSLALNVGNWWECSGKEIWAMNVRQSNLKHHFVCSVMHFVKIQVGLQRCVISKILLIWQVYI